MTYGRRGSSSLSPPALFGHPRHYATIPGTALLQGHPQHFGNPGRQDIATPAAMQLPVFCQPSPRIGVRTMIK
jgi:hypothetical protein